MDRRRFVTGLFGVALPAWGAQPPTSAYPAGSKVGDPPEWFTRTDIHKTRANYEAYFRKQYPPVEVRTEATTVRQGNVNVTTQSSVGESFPTATDDSKAWRRALDLADRSPKGPTPFAVLLYLANLTEAGPFGKPFNAEWDAPHTNPLIDFFFYEARLKRYSRDLIPWCAACINWCIKRAGFNSPDTATAADFARGKKTDAPKQGDIVLFHEYGSARISHVNLLVRDLGDAIECLGGNQTLDRAAATRGIVATRFKKVTVPPKDKREHPLVIEGYRSIEAFRA